MVNSVSIYDAIRHPVISEKATSLSALNQYVFKVDMHASKPVIRRAIMDIYDVDSCTVNLLVRKGKPKVTKYKGGRRRVRGSSSKSKIAIVTLPQGKVLDISRV